VVPAVVTNEYGAVKLASSVPGDAEVSGTPTDAPPGATSAEGTINAAFDTEAPAISPANAIILGFRKNREERQAIEGIRAPLLLCSYWLKRRDCLGAAVNDRQITGGKGDGVSTDDENR